MRKADDEWKSTLQETVSLAGEDQKSLRECEMDT